MNTKTIIEEYDLKNAVSKNRLVGVFRLMKGFGGKYIGASLSLGVSALSKTATYLLLRYFVDSFFSDAGMSISVLWIGLGFILLAILQGGFTFLSGRLAAQTAEGTVKRLRDYLFDHLQHLPFTYHDSTDTGELIQRVTSDVDAIRRFFADQAISFGRIVMLFLVNFVALLFINVKLAFISIAVIPFIVLLSMLFFKRISKAYEAFQEQEAVVSTTLQENLTGVRIVKAFAKQRYEIEKFQKNNWENFLRGKHLTVMHSLFWPVSDILCGLQLVFGYFIAATMAIDGLLTVGDYLAYAGMLVWIIFPMRNLGRLIVQMSTGMVSYSRVRTLIEETREDIHSGLSPEQETFKGAMQFKNVDFEYEDNQAILKDIGFDVKPGDVVALLGPTGSGKSSLVNLLPRFYEYTEGSITLDGIELKEYSRKYLRQQIGMVEQEPFLFSRTIRENITYGVGRDIPQDEIEQAARTAAVHDVVLDVLGGYDTVVGEKGTTLSGGQKQRLAIARALLKKPGILILDDSTSSVDTETESEIQEALQILMKGRTTFIIAHRIQSIMDADLILVLEKGQILQRGKHEELLKEEGFYKQIFEEQSQIDLELQKELDHV